MSLTQQENYNSQDQDLCTLAALITQETIHYELTLVCARQQMSSRAYGCTSVSPSQKNH